MITSRSNLVSRIGGVDAAGRVRCTTTSTTATTTGPGAGAVVDKVRRVRDNGLGLSRRVFPADPPYERHGRRGFRLRQ